MITGKRIVLRAWERADLDAFLRWFNDPEVTVYLGDAYPAVSVEHEERFYENVSSDERRYCIVTIAENRLIGNCSLHRIDTTDRSCEVGIVLGEKDCWNQGYGREALGLLLAIAFEGLGLHRVGLRHVDFNERGHRAYIAAGFQEEGRLRQAVFARGSFYDEVVMSVLAEEYWARKRCGS